MRQPDFIALTPVPPAVPPKDTVCRLFEGSLVGALMKRTTEAPRLDILSLDGSQIMQRGIPTLAGGKRGGVYRRVVMRDAGAYYLPKAMASCEDALQASLDDLYGYDKNAAQYGAAISVERLWSGSFAPYIRPHFDFRAARNARQPAMPVVQYAAVSVAGPDYWVLPRLTRIGAEQLAFNLYAPFNDGVFSPYYQRTAEWVMEKFSDNVRLARPAPGMLTRSTPLSLRADPRNQLTQDRIELRIDFYAPPKPDYLDDLSEKLQSNVKGAWVTQDELDTVCMFRPAAYVGWRQQQHARWGERLQPIVESVSARFGDLAAVPPQIRARVMEEKATL